MKYRFIAILIAFVPVSALAQNPNPVNIDSTGLPLQNIIDQLYLNLSPTDTNEGGLKRKVEFFERFWTARASYNDSINGNMFSQYYKGLNNEIHARSSVNNSVANTFQGNWRCMGPFESPVQNIAYISAIWADPADSNYILAGTYGGLFKTTDGGANWTCITDNAPIAGGITIVNWIAVNPLNKNTIYLGTVAEATLTSNGSAYGAALIKSYDGGVTWQQEIIPIEGIGGYADSITMVQKVYFTPDSTRLYAFHSDSVYTRANTISGVWENITPSGVDENSIFYDLEFDPTDQTHFFISNTIGDDKPEAAIWESNAAVPTTTDWTNITAGLSDTLINFNPTLGGGPVSGVMDDDDFARIEMSIPDGNTLYMIGIHVEHPQLIGLWSYDYSSQTPTWTLINNSMPYHVNPTRLTFELAVSPAQTSNNGYRRNIYYGIDLPYHSYDGGVSFKALGTYAADTSGPTHPDIRGFALQSATNSLRGINDRLYIATDGGVSKLAIGVDDSLVTSNKATIDISGHGLTANHFWSIDISEHGGLAIAGAMHNGAFSYEPKDTTKWFGIERQSTLGKMGDYFTAMFDNDNREMAHILYVDNSRYFSVAQNGRRVGFLDYQRAGAPGVSPPPFTYFPGDTRLLDPPMDKTNANKHYVGTGRVWRRYASELKWYPDFSPKSTNIGGNNNLKNVKDLYFLPDDTAYVGYVLFNGIEGLYYIDMYNRNNTPPQPLPSNKIVVPNVGTNGYPLNAITVDPSDINKIWIAYGGTNWFNTSPTTNRVRYSPDKGTTWIDISKGLPLKVSVNDIVYYEGNQTLYCATDVGIYACDFSDYDQNATSNNYNASVEWIYFSKGLIPGKDFPNVYVTQLKINHCEGKLFASTYGRSIWVTDLFEDDFIVKPNREIITNTTWDNTLYLEGSVIVKSGATLAISGDSTTIYMPKNAVITIEPNAKLIVDSATITNGCEDCLWGGIRVSGDLFKAQSTLNQGKVELNDATIANASYAIGNYDENKSAITTGGIIEATNTTFLNNERSVDLFEYNSSQYSAIKNYQATFTTCTFEINNDYKFDNGAGYLGTNPHRFFAHVGLFKVDGVQFKGCEFYNRNNGQYEGWGEGITSTDGGFTVQSHCTNPNNSPCLANDLVKSQFRGFKHGIWIEKDLQKNLATKVDQAQFDSCSFGIRIVNPSYSELTRNEFTIGNGKEVDINNFDCHKNVGIFATSALAPIIEDNSFQGITHSGQHQDHENIGVVIENIGNNNVQVYKNSFDDLSKGCLALGNNDLDDHKSHVSINNKGVKFLCNSFADNTFDIYVSTDPASNGHVIYGIANYQGDTKSDAGNTFSTSPTNHIYNTGAAFNYFYDPSLTNGQPTSINSASQITVTTASDNNECPSHYNPTGGAGWNTPLTGSGITGLKANFLTYKDKRDNAQDLLNDYIDNGNTTGLTTFIDNSMVVDTPIVRDTLIKTSPYVSEAALRSTANINTLDQTVLIDILKANPEVLRNEVFLSFLENDIPNPLSSTQIDDLRTASATSTNRTTLEAEASEYDHLMSIVANVIIGHYLLDTTTTSLDSIPGWYDSLNTLEAEYAKVAFYTGIADYSSAETVMDNIPTKFTLTQEQSDDHDVYDDLWTLFKGVLDDDRNMFQLTTAEETSLNTILTTEVSPNGGMKQIIDVITDTYGPPARLACFTSIGLGEPKRGNVINNNGNTTIYDNPILKVYPNPANDYVIFEYNFKDDINNLQLEVINTLGQSVYKQPLQGKSGRQHWNTTSIASGIYNYSITENGKKLESGKIVIQK